MNLAELASNLGLDWRLFVFQLVNALIVLYVLKRFAFTPIMKVVDQRERFAKEAEERMKEANKALDDAVGQSKAILEEAKEKYHTIVDEAVTDAQTRKARILAESEQEASLLKESILKSADQQALTMKQAAARELKEAVISVTEKLVKNEVNHNRVTTLAEELLH